MADNQHHAFLARQVLRFKKRREVEQRHDAAVQVHEAEQVRGHARQWIDVGHLDQFARGRERRQQAHVANAERLANDVVRILGGRRCAERRQLRGKRRQSES